MIFEGFNSFSMKSMSIWVFDDKQNDPNMIYLKICWKINKHKA